jgi:hypothetical protein
MLRTPRDELTAGNLHNASWDLGCHGGQVSRSRRVDFVFREDDWGKVDRGWSSKGDFPEATMNSRSRWVGGLILVGAFGLIAAGRGFADHQENPSVKPGDFVQAGRFTINKTRIDYLERGERGQLYVYFTSKNSIILTDDAAKKLLQAIGPDEPVRSP